MRRAVMREAGEAAGLTVAAPLQVCDVQLQTRQHDQVFLLQEGDPPLNTGHLLLQPPCIHGFTFTQMLAAGCQITRVPLTRQKCMIYFIFFNLFSANTHLLLIGSKAGFVSLITPTLRFDITWLFSFTLIQSLLLLLLLLLRNNLAVTGI